MVAFQDLLKLRDESSNTFYKSYFELELRKDKAFASGDVFKHCSEMDDVKIPREELVKNRMVTRTMMFKEVGRYFTQENLKVKDMQLFFAYLNSQVYKEGDWLRDWETKRCLKALTEFSNLKIELLSEVPRT